ncbi:MAG: YbjN domain-containing protein, partial [Xanthobacteraceae bacterium]
LGHFDLWSEEGLVMYRDGLVLSGGAEASGRQCEALLENAVSAAERYYPAFQFVIWAGKNAREAMDATLFETAGEA